MTKEKSVNRGRKEKSGVDLTIFLNLEYFRYLK